MLRNMTLISPANLLKNAGAMEANNFIIDIYLNFKHNIIIYNCKDMAYENNQKSGYHHYASDYGYRQLLDKSRSNHFNIS